MKQETFDLVLGLGVLVLGIGILLFTFASAFALASDPGRFIQDQLPTQPQATTGPTASFTWSSNGFNLTVQDTSRAGSSAIASWSWDFGDGSPTASGRSPGIHTYANPGPYTLLLTVTDGNGQSSTTFSPVDIVPAEPRSGLSVGDVTSQIPSFNLNLGDILLPVGVGVLTVGLFMAMAVVGGLITKAGWNLIRPRPETIRIRLKPKYLQQMIEQDTVPPPPPQA